MAKSRKSGKKEDNWKLTKVFEYLEKNPFERDGHKALKRAIEELEKHNWNVSKALEQDLWFSNKPS